jgi:ABC-type thiamin/hydroxymethylpyrimidine transport system permease subunit
MIATWLLPALLGIGLAASCGLRTFLPLLLVSLAARFHLFGFEPNGHLAWLGSLPALAALTVATVAEFIGDKIPLVDHGLALVGTVTRPAAGALAAASAFHLADPGTAALAGLILGVPTALAFHTAQTGTRVASTATTAGLGNPVVSLAEDGLAAGTVLMSMAYPMLVPIIAVAVLFVVWRLVRSVGRRLEDVNARTGLPR